MPTKAHPTSDFPAAHQRGVSTLVVAIVLLIAATFITFLATKVGVQEQRMSGNDYRHKETFSVAEAGLDRAKAFLAANRQDFGTWGWTACAGTETTPPCGDGAANLFGAAWSWLNVYSQSGGTALAGLAWPATTAAANGPFIVTQTTPAAITPTTSFQPITLLAQAASADGTGSAVVRQSMSRFLIAQPGPVPPIMAPTVPLGGNFTVVGNPNHDLDIMDVTLANCESLTGSGQMLSIWSPTPLPSSGTWQTCGFGSFRDGTSPTANRCIGPNIVDPATGNTPTWNQCRCQVNAAEKSPYSGNSEGINDDIVDNDPAFPNGIFAYVFGRTKSAVKASATVLPNCAGLNASSTGLYWITGDCDLSNNQTIGSRAAPAIVVTEQNMRFQGTSHFWGLMVGADMERTCTGGSGDPYYVGGACTSPSPSRADIQGTFTLHGAMIVEGTVDGVGTYNAVYDPCVFAAMGAGTSFDQYGPIAGSWNDAL